MTRFNRRGWTGRNKENKETQRQVKKKTEEGTRGEQGRKISTIEVKEEQNKGTEGEQGQRLSKFVRSKAMYWHDASEGERKEVRKERTRKKK